MVRCGKEWWNVVKAGMQKVVRFLIDVEDKQRIEEEAKKLGLKSSSFLRLLIKLHFNGLRLERKELANKGRKQDS